MSARHDHRTGHSARFGQIRDGRPIEAHDAMAVMNHAVSPDNSTAEADRTDDALDSHHGSDDLTLLMMDLVMPTEPFAAARGAARHGRRVSSPPAGRRGRTHSGPG
jgi:hypothetical protein